MWVDGCILKNRGCWWVNVDAIDVFKRSRVHKGIFTFAGLASEVVEGPYDDQSNAGDTECSKWSYSFDGTRQTYTSLVLLQSSDRFTFLNSPKGQPTHESSHDSDEDLVNRQ